MIVVRTKMARRVAAIRKNSLKHREKRSWARDRSYVTAGKRYGNRRCVADAVALHMPS